MLPKGLRKFELVVDRELQSEAGEIGFRHTFSIIPSPCLLQSRSFVSGTNAGQSPPSSARHKSGYKVTSPASFTSMSRTNRPPALS